MNSKTCREVRREIDESDLRLRLSGEIVTHVASCAPCHQFQQERSRLRELVGSLEPVTAPPDFDMRLRARIAAERQRPARGSIFSQFLVSTPAMAGAAALVLVLAASLVWFSQRSQRQATTTTAQSANQPIKSSEAAPPVKSESPAPILADYPENSSAGEKGERAIAPRVANPRSGDNLIARRSSATAEFNARTAITISKTPDAPGEVSLSAPDKPLVVSVEDDSGMRRNISLPPVSFGSQRLVDNRVPVSTNGRVW